MGVAAGQKIIQIVTFHKSVSKPDSRPRARARDETLGNSEPKACRQFHRGVALSGYWLVEDERPTQIRRPTHWVALFAIRLAHRRQVEKLAKVRARSSGLDRAISGEDEELENRRTMSR